MGVLSWIAVGAIVGLVARRIVPGTDPGRFVITILLGMAGISFLYGLCAGVGRVALNPLPEMAAEKLRLVSVSRERFVNWIVDSLCFDSPGARHHACGLVRLL